jgi:dihydrofolate synthase/folylpolyglutamate synthase
MNEGKSDQVLARLLQLHPKIIDLSLDRMWEILDKLGHPERRLPPVLHVSGTNGKGSLLAYLRAILEAAGYKVHVYTSPHLVRFAERIRLAGRIIDEQALHELLVQCETVNGETPITYFEITTAAAFQAFADTPADILLLETGLGGRLDATNVIDKPHVTAITPISQDHAQYLGTDLAGIAGEKAGIMRKEVPVVIGPQDNIVLPVLKERAEILGAQPYIYGENWSCSSIGEDWQFQGELHSGNYPMPNLAGVHQLANAATALACLDRLPEFTISADQIRKGLTTVHWPARMQRLSKGPLLDTLPGHVEVWLDGGHNPAAGRQIAASFDAFNQIDPKPTYLIAGMLNTKDQTSFFKELKPVITAGHTVPIPGETASTPPEKLSVLAQNGGMDLSPMPSIDDAVASLLSVLSQRPCRLLIAGSLYLAGQVLREND